MITVEDGGTPLTPSQTDHQMNTFFHSLVLPTATDSRRWQQPARVGLAATNDGVDDRKIKHHVGTKHEKTSPPGVMGLDALHSSTRGNGTVEALSRENTQSCQPSRFHKGQDFQFHLPNEQQQQLQAMSNGVGKGTKSSSSLNEERSGSREIDYRKLMQQSVSQGMPGIMNKVVTENKRHMQQTSSSSSTPTLPHSQDKGTSLLLPHAQFKPLYYSPGLGERRIKRRAGGEAMVLRALVCSPMETASRKYPEFVFTPGPDTKSVTERFGGESKDHSNSDDNFDQDSQIVAGNETPSRVTVVEGEESLQNSESEVRTLDALKGNIKLSSIARKLECDFEDNETKVKQSKFQSKTRSSDSHLLNNETTSTREIRIPYSHHSTTSRSVLTVMFERSLTIPVRYHSRASLYPNFVRSAYHSSDMDIMESLHTLLDIKFKHQCHQLNTHSKKKAHTTKQHGCSTSTTPTNHSAVEHNVHVPSTETLMHEARKSHLICGSSSRNEQQKMNVSLKRPSSFHFRRTGSDNSGGSTCSSSLDSPVKREIIMRKAAEAVKQRQIQSGNKDDLFEKHTEPILTSTQEIMKSPMDQDQEFGYFAKSLDNLTMPNALHSTPTSLSTRSLIFSDPSHYKRHKSVLRRARSFQECSKYSQSLEALHAHAKSPIQREVGDEELLYTLQRRRPVTVLVRSVSSLALVHESQAGPKTQSTLQASNFSSNLATTKSASSQGITEAVAIERSKNSTFKGMKGKKRFSLNRPTSAPASRSRNNGIDGLMTSIHLKADKLWWNEL